VPSPNPAPGGDVLNSVTATSARDAWAVGANGAGALVLHWNGRAWQQVARAWVVGGGFLTTLIESWNGTTWG
jgi:hypothetical protein